MQTTQYEGSCLWVRKLGEMRIHYLRVVIIHPKTFSNRDNTKWHSALELSRVKLFKFYRIAQNRNHYKVPRVATYLYRGCAWSSIIALSTPPRSAESTGGLGSSIRFVIEPKKQKSSGNFETKFLDFCPDLCSVFYFIFNIFSQFLPPNNKIFLNTICSDIIVAKTTLRSSNR